MTSDASARDLEAICLLYTQQQTGMRNRNRYFLIERANRWVKAIL